jgi:hypothetical protein
VVDTKVYGDWNLGYEVFLSVLCALLFSLR